MAKQFKKLLEVFEIITFFLTDKYEIFNTIHFNRKICKSHVKKLEKSMKRWGFKGVIQVIKTNVIDGKMRYYILDGQHRILAAMRLNLKIPFQITHLKTKKELADFIADLNNTSKGWAPSQFLRVWNDFDMHEYKVLKETFEKTGFQISALIEAFTFQGNMEDFRQGNLIFPNEVESLILVQQLLELNKYLPTKAFCRRTIIKLMRQKRYNHKIMKLAIPAFVAVDGGFSENEKILRVQFQEVINGSCPKV